MKEGIRILVVEDEFITQKAIRESLNELGYLVSGDAMDADEALAVLEKKNTDLAILDIHIHGEKDGVWIARQIREKYKIPFIFLTANADKNTVQRATETEPNGYLVKPFNKNDIFVAIETALRNYSGKSTQPDETEETLLLQDSVFIKENLVYKKIKYGDILYIKSEGHYLDIHTRSKKHVVRGSLKEFINTPATKHLLQVHRSYVINLTEIEGFSQDSVHVNKAEIPLAASFKEEFLKNIRTM